MERTPGAGRGDDRLKRALWLIFAISLFGMAFSGLLSYREVFGAGAAPCPAPGAPGTVFGYPACVYGFFMYLIIAVVSAAGLTLGQRAPSGSGRVGGDRVAAPTP